METRNQTPLENYFQLAVDAYNQNASTFGVDNISTNEKNHILINTRSILMARDKVFIPLPGSFTERFIEGNLFRIYDKADSFCLKSLPFYIHVYRKTFLD